MTNEKFYLDLEAIKQHLNISLDYSGDDLYLYALLSVCQAAVEKHIDRKLSELEDEDGDIPAPIGQAILLLIGTFYAVRESVSSASMTPVPHTFDYLCDLYKNYNANKSILD